MTLARHCALQVSPSSFASHFDQFPLCPLRNHEMEEDQHFDTLQDFKDALENWSVDAKFRYRVKKKRQLCPISIQLRLLLTIIRKRSIVICTKNMCSEGLEDIADRIWHYSGCGKTAFFPFWTLETRCKYCAFNRLHITLVR